MSWPRLSQGKCETAGPGGIGEGELVDKPTQLAPTPNFELSHFDILPIHEPLKHVKQPVLQIKAAGFPRHRQQEGILEESLGY